MSQKVVYDNEVHFWTTSTWSVWKYHALATPLLLGHACRKCHVPVFLSRHVSWQCRGKSHFNNMILSGNLCVVVSGWHWTVLCMMLCVVVFIGQRTQFMVKRPIRGQDLILFLLISMTHLAMLEEWDWFYAEFRVLDINHARHKCTAAVITSGIIKNWTTHFYRDLCCVLWSVTEKPQGQ